MKLELTSKEHIPKIRSCILERKEKQKTMLEEKTKLYIEYPKGRLPVFGEENINEREKKREN